MKSKLSLLLTGAVVAFLLLTSAVARAQTGSLGDYARAARKNKPAPSSAAPRVYDNDNLPVTSTLSVVGKSKDSSDDAQGDGACKTATDSTGQNSGTEKSEKQPEIQPDQSADEREKAVGEWKQKIAAQKAKVDLASRELDVMQQEYRVKEAEFYANTASRVQNPNGFAADDAKYQQQVTDRQKSLDEAKQKLSNLQDEARKAGAPSSAVE
jgi:hypothetical protein